MPRLFCLFLTLIVSSCVSLPDVYLIDRHTIMEAEASGEWPELEQRFSQTAITKGSTNLESEPSDKRTQRAFQVLNGEFPNQTGTAK